jgi:hypothetical protein
MFTVRWKKSALNELAALWVQADAGMRKAITDATLAVDQGLRQDPNHKGESRVGEERVWFVFPLGVLFETEEASVVRVLHVWVYRRRK